MLLLIVFGAESRYTHPIPSCVLEGTVTSRQQQGLREEGAGREERRVGTVPATTDALPWCCPPAPEKGLRADRTRSLPPLCLLSRGRYEIRRPALCSRWNGEQAEEASLYFPNKTPV